MKETYAFASLNGGAPVDLATLRFYHLGSLVRGDQTPADLDMADGDKLVILPADAPAPAVQSRPPRRPPGPHDPASPPLTSLTEALSAVRANGGIPLTKRSSHIAGAPKVATRLEAIFAGTVVSAASGHGVYEAGVAVGVAFRPGKIAMYLNISDPTLEHDLCMCILSIDFHVQDPLTGGHHFRVDALCSIPGFD